MNLLCLHTKDAEFCSGHAKDGRVDPVHKRCTHRDCPAFPSLRVTESKVCGPHAEEVMVNLTTFNNLSDVNVGSGSARGRGSLTVDEGTAGGASAGGKRTGRSLLSTTTETSAARSTVDSKQTCQAPFHTPWTPTSIEVAVDEGRTPVEDGSFSEPDDTAIKTEVVVPSKKGLTEAFPGEAMVGEWITPAGDGSHVEPGGAVKTELGISFPSKRPATEGKLKTMATAASAESNMSPLSMSLNFGHLFLLCSHWIE